MQRILSFNRHCGRLGFAVLFSLTTQIVFGQDFMVQWESYWGDTIAPSHERLHDELYDVELSPDGNIYVVGLSQQMPPTTLRGFCRKISPTGQEAWSRYLQSNEQNLIRGICIRDSLALFAVGQIEQAAWFLEINSETGDTTWDHRITFLSGFRAYDAVPTQMGYTVIGFRPSSIFPLQQAALLSVIINTLGDTISSRLLLTLEFEDIIENVAIESQNGDTLLLLMHTLIGLEAEEVDFVVLTTTHGDTLWTRRIAEFIGNPSVLVNSAFQFNNQVFLSGYDESSDQGVLVVLSIQGELIQQFAYEWRNLNGLAPLGENRLVTVARSPLDLSLELLLLHSSGQIIDSLPLADPILSGWNGYGGFRMVKTQTNDAFLCGKVDFDSPDWTLTRGIKISRSSQVTSDHVPVLVDFLSTFPNPFNSTLSISLSIPLHQTVTVSLYDLLGREVDVIHRGRLESSTIYYAAPANLSSGIYFVRAATGTQTVMQKVVLLK